MGAEHYHGVGVDGLAVVYAASFCGLKVHLGFGEVFGKIERSEVRYVGVAFAKILAKLCVKRPSARKAGVDM
jgi:hypothetical protein